MAGGVRRHPDAVDVCVMTVLKGFDRSGRTEAALQGCKAIDGRQITNAAGAGVVGVSVGDDIARDGRPGVNMHVAGWAVGPRSVE